MLECDVLCIHGEKNDTVHTNQNPKTGCQINKNMLTISQFDAHSNQRFTYLDWIFLTGKI